MPASLGWITSVSLADDSDRLNFDEELRDGKILRRDQSACRKSALENFAADFDELVAVRLIADEHGHGDDIGERPASLLERRLDVLERPPGLAGKIRDRLAVGVSDAAHAGEPDDAAAIRDDGGRIGPCLRTLGSFDELGSVGNRADEAAARDEGGCEQADGHDWSLLLKDGRCDGGEASRRRSPENGVSVQAKE